MRTHGSHGPSGLELDEWRKILPNYGQYSIDLCKTIAQLPQRIACGKLIENQLEAYNACRLIPLDKCPGIRPIGIEDGLSADASEKISKRVAMQLNYVLDKNMELSTLYIRLEKHTSNQKLKLSS